MIFLTILAQVIHSYLPTTPNVLKLYLDGQTSPFTTRPKLTINMKYYKLSLIQWKQVSSPTLLETVWFTSIQY